MSRALEEDGTPAAGTARRGNLGGRILNRHFIAWRFVIALKSYLLLKRSWHCAWAMADRPGIKTPPALLRGRDAVGRGELRQLYRRT
jgi:hypothetical protein